MSPQRTILSSIVQYLKRLLVEDVTMLSSECENIKTVFDKLINRQEEINEIIFLLSVFLIFLDYFQRSSQNTVVFLGSNFKFKVF